MDSRGVPSTLGNLGTGFLKPELAREILFERILDQLADSSLFSSGVSPTIFIVYAHNNDKEGAAYDECVRKLIKWLERIHAQILSDHSPLPPFVPRIEGIDPIGNILGNQMCLLPPSCYGAETPKVRTVDKVIVCGSEVLEGYCSKLSAQAYVEEIVRICNESADHLTDVALESRIRERVEEECDSNILNFHHVLTELAFLQARKCDLSDTHGMVPVVLSQANPDEAPMRCLPVFWNTDVKLKLSSPAASSLHKLFFKLLKRLFADDKEFIQSFRECYDLVTKDLGLDSDATVAQDRFNHIVNQHITKAYQQYWKVFCMVIRNGKLQAYAGKLSNQVSHMLEVTQTTQHDILDWLSPNPASNYHGKYHDLGTSRMEVGTGKTYSASRVIDWVGKGLETNTNDEAFAYFYCNKQDLGRSEPKEILRNIIRQLATGSWSDHVKNAAVHKAVYELWRKGRGRGILSTFAEWEACLLELIDTYPRTTIVLDALDECTVGKREALIKLLVKLATRSPHARPVKIFVAARPEDDIRRQLGEDHVIMMQEKHNAPDIKKFIRSKVTEHRRWFTMPRDFQNEVIDTLLKKSGDMFLFASLQIQRLLDCDTKATLRDRLATLPGSLNTIYEELCESATSGPEERKLLDRALQWVVCSARPLTTRELLFAVSQDSGSDGIKPQIEDLDEHLILLWTRNLLSLDVSRKKGPPVWRLAHQAVAEFLEKSTWCNSSLAHCETGKVCLMMLLDTFGTNTTDLRNGAHDGVEYVEDFECPCGSITSPDEHNLHHELPSPLTEYAIYGWPTHVRAQEDHAARNIKELSQTLREFLGRPEQGTRAYKRWLDHAFHFRHTNDVPKWSIFKIRRMPIKKRIDSTTMVPVVLACHLGIYTCLSGWWHFSYIDYDSVYHSSLWWAPNLKWEMTRFTIISCPRWSLFALACVHNEARIIKHLLRRNVRVDTIEDDHVPPLVAAAVSGSEETVKYLIERGAGIYSPFTTRHGDLLRFAIEKGSLGLMRILLQHPALSQAFLVETILGSLECWDIKSEKAMAMLIGMGVDVNTRLNVGTLLRAAAERGWESMVSLLLEKGAHVNPTTSLGNHESVLENVIATSSPSPSIVALLIHHGSHVNSRTVTTAWESATSFHWARINRSVASREIIQLLLGCKPDLNETWIEGRKETSALIKAVTRGDLDHVRLLLGHGADVNLHVENQYYGNALDFVFLETLDHGIWDKSYPFGALVDVLVEAGASLQNLEGDRLHTALAAAAFVAVEDMVQDFLDRGANPIAECGHKYCTALGAAAASGHPRASAVVHTLLDNGPDINTDYSFFRTARFALDGPLCNFILRQKSWTNDRLVKPRRVSWLASAFTLAVNHAVWDIDFTQWNNCLKLRMPEFWEQNSEALAKLQDILANNRAQFFLKFPEAAFHEDWSITDAKDARHASSRRAILREMSEMLP